MPAARAACDPGRAVLDDRAVGGRDAHPRRRVQEEVGRRLAAWDLGRAEDAAGEALVETRLAERVAHLLVAPARRDAGRRADAVERLDDPVHRLKLGIERLPVEVEVLRVPVGRERTAEMLLDLAAHVVVRVSDEPLGDLRLRQRPPDARQNDRVHADGDPLGVHEDSIAIEDHELRSAHAGAKSPRERLTLTACGASENR